MTNDNADRFVWKEGDIEITPGLNETEHTHHNADGSKTTHSHEVGGAGHNHDEKPKNTAALRLFFPDMVDDD